MISIPFVRSFWGQPFIRLFKEIGAPVDRYIEESKIPEEVVDNPEVPCPAPLMYRFLAQLAREEGLHHEAMKIGKNIPIRTWGGFGSLVASEPTLLRAIQTAKKWMPAVHSARTLTFSHDGQQARLSSKLSGMRSASSPWESHLLLFLMIDLVRMAAGPHWFPEEVALETESVGNTNGWRDCELFSRARIRQGSGTTAVLFPRDFLTLPLERGCRTLSLESEIARRAFDTAPLPADLVNSLRSTLELLVPQGYFDIKTAAEVIGVSRRTLQRYLQENGTTFTDVLGRARLSVARRRLADSSSKVIDVAYDAGYSDPAHFTNAFRRWTGFNPRAYRMLFSEPQTAA